MTVRPLVLTADPDLLDDVLRLAAAAGTEPDVADHVAAATESWRTAPLALVGADLVDDLLASGLPRRPGLLVLTRGPDDDRVLWRKAMTAGAEVVVLIPDSDGWLVDRLASVGPGAPRATVVAVVGARGGAGASTLAVGLSLAGARGGWRTLLVDTDPYGGGIDLALGAEDETGPRWKDLAASGAPPPTPEALTAALPRCGEVTVLAWSRESPAIVPPSVVELALGAARRGADLVVVDVPRTFGDAARVALSAADVVYVVCPAELRACAAGQRVVATVRTYVDDVRVVVRGPVVDGFDAVDVAEALGLPLAGFLDPEPNLERAYQRRRPPGSGGRGPLARLCRALVVDLPRPARDEAVS